MQEKEYTKLKKGVKKGWKVGKGVRTWVKSKKMGSNR